MAKHKVKCAVCNQIFDLNAEQGVRYNGRRYAHEACFPQGEKVGMIIKSVETPKVEEVTDIIKEEEEEKILTEKEINLDDTEGRKYVIDIADKYMGRENCNFALITQQIKRFKKDLKFTYVGMGKTLIYFYGVKKGDPRKGNGGIGICEFQYEEARKYFKQVKEIQEKNKQTGKIDKENEIEIITIKKPVREINRGRLFQFLEEE